MLKNSTKILGFAPLFENQINQFGLADLRGDTWKRMKRQLTPTMSIPRLKKNVSEMNDIGRKVGINNRFLFYFSIL